ncbi:MAG: threonine synthase [Holophagales bacterium]|nr:threonine synthase [Holophagales bacterium]
MRFVSTRDPDGESYSLAGVLRLGPAPDGGLFMPERIDPLPESFWNRLAEAPLAEIGTAVMRQLLGDALDGKTVHEIAASALDFPIPLVSVAPGRQVLELFHGPTLAFKDVGARFLARLLPATRGSSGSGTGERSASASTVLVATSGDTGGAVAQAFHGVEGTRVAILYPRGKVSPLQERQFASLGGNVRAFAVDGVFDDCQRLVKSAFADRELAEGLGLTSANSINVGRLLPQAIYYVHASAQAGRRPGGPPLLFVTPSGNFGNLTAGVIAARLGLGARFVAATNVNDVVPAYLETGLYEPRDSRRTISNAMDVGDPNNFERLLHLFGHDEARLRRDLVGARFTDRETRAAIARVEGEHGYLLDPHTAVGWLALERVASEGEAVGEGIILGTAHPAKFGEVVEPVIGRPIPLPEALARHSSQPVRSAPLDNDPADLRRELLAWAS